jgi:hypothetical protein
MSCDHLDGEWVEITGGDVWEAVKTGVKLSFFTGIVAAVIAACTVQDIWDLGPVNCLALFLGWLVFGAGLYLPLRLAAVATARSRGLLPGLIRFAHGLVVVVGTAAIVLVLLARLVIYLLYLVLQVGG